MRHHLARTSLGETGTTAADRPDMKRVTSAKRAGTRVSLAGENVSPHEASTITRAVTLALVVAWLTKTTTTLPLVACQHAAVIVDTVQLGNPCEQHSRVDVELMTLCER